MATLDEAKQAADEAREGDALRENDAGVPDQQRVDYDEYDVPSLKLNPEALVTFSHIVGLSVNQFGNDDFLDAEQNLQNAGPQQYGYDVTLTVAEPEVAEGDVWIEDDEEYTTYRVLGDPSSDESPYGVNYDSEGDPTGVDLGMGGFEGERDDGGIDATFVQIEISSRRAVNVLGALDTAGRWAHSRDGEFVEGIIETPPSDAHEDTAPRAIGFPELRADMVGEEGAIAFTFGTDDGEEPTTQTFVDVSLFRFTDDGLEALTALTPDDDAYALPTYPRGGNLYWDDHEGPEEIEGDTVDEAATSISFGGGSTDLDDLDDQDQQYVRDAVEFLDGHEADDLRDVLDDFESTYDDQIENGEATGTLDADEMADIVAAQV